MNITRDVKTLGNARAILGQWGCVRARLVLYHGEGPEAM